MKGLRFAVSTKSSIALEEIYPFVDSKIENSLTLRERGIRRLFLRCMGRLRRPANLASRQTHRPSKALPPLLRRLSPHSPSKVQAVLMCENASCVRCESNATCLYYVVVVIPAYTSTPHSVMLVLHVSTPKQSTTVSHPWQLC